MQSPVTEGSIRLGPYVKTAARLLGISDVRGAFELLGSATFVYIFVSTRGTVDFSFENPKATYIVPAFILLILLGRRLSIPVWLWWCWGALTLVWSVAPGASHATILWEITYLAAFAAAWWRPAVWFAAVYVIANGLADQLALSTFGLAQYMSGSVHYVAGAQALALVPVTLVNGFRSRRIVTQVLWGSLAALALYSSLISGARAVYLPLIVILLALAVRVFFRREGELRRVAAVLATVVMIIAVLDSALPNRPMATALGLKTSIELQAASVTDRGNFTQRLRFLDQTLAIAVEHPLGAGVGTYQSVINSYQKYPMVWSNSPHNYYVETAATGGWVRVVLLLAMIGLVMLRCWRSKEWHWALAAAGIWATLAFDVTSYYPAFMMFAFLTLGAAFHSSVSTQPAVPRGAVTIGIQTIGITVALSLSAWWFWPCTGSECFFKRYHGAEFLASGRLGDMPPSERLFAFERLRRLYPESIWVPRMEQQYSEDPQRLLELAEEVALRFPLQSPFNYLTWGEMALAAGNHEQAKRAITTGLSVFGPDSYPYGEFRMNRDLYQGWLDDAKSLLAQLDSP